MARISASGIFCEDVRKEISGQETIVGIYPDKIVVPSFPGQLPKISIYVRFHIDVKYNPKLITLKLLYPDESAMILTEIDPSLIQKTRREAKNSGSPIFGLISKSMLAPLRVEKTGRLLLIAEVDSKEHIAGQMNFIEFEHPTSHVPAS